ncbi:type II toxin-antitoxin system RelE/ParE family toxin [Micromonospora sp. NPDC048842]|uniref:type II toxin-antitoxin system RelE/ParE family toxin n=1 Tax=Micromonospora sp. NPDC048842 TaxID=3154346 RepID=UPI0033DF29B7
MWDVKLHPQVEEWFLNLCKTDPASADLISEAIDLLAEHGPALGRPLVDRLKGSIFHHMKELRPGSTGSTEIRMIFAFDPVREAVFLVAGDKSGQWQTWHKTAVPLADDRFQEHLSRLRETQR